MNRKSWLPELDRQVWILMAGRLLSAIGTGFTLFYAPIFFSQIGLSKTMVGIALGSQQISGIFGRLFGGSLTDAPGWGRRRTLLLSAAVSAIASFALAAAIDFPTLLLGNLIMGLGVGLYWPSTEAVVADLTDGSQRQEAYALTRLGDSLGLGVGILVAGGFVSLTNAYRPLFVIDGITFAVFFWVIYWGISQTQLYDQQLDAENRSTDSTNVSFAQGWKIALRDRALLLFVAVNIIFTTYISQIQTTMPLYFNESIQWGATDQQPAVISALFSWHILLAVIFQLPIAKFLRRFSHPQALSVSALFWIVGFLTIFTTGLVASYQIIWAVLGLALLTLGMVSYLPSASSLVADIAPVNLRGVYLSVNSLCWAVGYFIGPSMGGFALDQPRPYSDMLWVGLALSTLLVLLLLRFLHRMMPKR
ncbi:MFS transporter [Geitlerinema sp. PCC 9228]|uniref:MDR family MFS transporter n=1 Tax=Geitlerinema sp. PCC 9228 TaxID=111611 RepID=UPI0008F9D7A2|nr:MFS transporter [Geitlerinema sp. PCC 9228]